MSTPGESTAVQLRGLCQRLGERQIILASNRGPYEYHLTGESRLEPRRGGGGLVTALSSLSQYVELTWVASAMGEGDRRMKEKMQGRHFKAPGAEENLNIHFVVTPRSMYHKYYSVFCNPLLWFLQHYMWNSSHTPNIDEGVHDAWENGYIPVNQDFAKAIVEEVAGHALPPLVMLNDYHLYLTASYIRREIPQLTLQHFTHIPWPDPNYWRLLTAPMREEICKGLCANDIVGFQTRRDVHNFLYCCESFLEGVEVNYSERTVCFNGHLTQAHAYPASVDVAALERAASSAKVQEYEQKLRPLCGDQTIVRVDRAEPSKNIVRGFRAFDKLLQSHPELIGKLKFLVFLVPTRTHLKPYRRYLDEITRLVEEINSKYGTEEWHPIEVFYENNRLQAIAAMRLYDVLLVNAVIDGMNLVAKEGPIVNTRDGVLILSEGAGAYEQLGAHALSVAAADLEGTMQALYTALTMPVEEKKRRATVLKKIISEEDITRWLYRQLDGLLRLPQLQPAPTTQGTVPHHPHL